MILPRAVLAAAILAGCAARGAGAGAPALAQGSARPQPVEAGPAPVERARASDALSPGLPAVADVPAGQRWLDHFRQDLLPFWDLPDAWGEPRGAFPTWRCNDGHRVDPARPCPELDELPAVPREWTRMRSRQAYLYGVAFHLTGDPRLLALARDGVAWIRAHALERDTGSAVSWFDGEVGGPPVLERTSQDLAYAGLGLAMYFYLTRDEAVLEDLARLKDHVFGAYWDPRAGMLRWVAREGHADAVRQELVAQLDQLNAYLLLVAPLLPEPRRAAWRADCVRLARLLVARFWSREEHVFWGVLHDPEERRLGGRHVDFGHTAKALWMIERVGRLAGAPDLVAFAAAEGPRLLARAFVADTGSWGSRPWPGGRVDAGKEWWIYAELDQLAATLALADRAQARFLARSYDFWLRRMVDHEHGDVWAWVSARGEPTRGPKLFQWKNGYHQAEHALVAYLTAQALHGEPATLHFALPPGAAPLRAYLFAGTVAGMEDAPLDGFAGRRRVTARFTGIR